jgi:hypothetical protein
MNALILVFIEVFLDLPPVVMACIDGVRRQEIHIVNRAVNRAFAVAVDRVDQRASATRKAMAQRRACARELLRKAICSASMMKLM